MGQLVAQKEELPFWGVGVEMWKEWRATLLEDLEIKRKGFYLV